MKTSSCKQKGRRCAQEVKDSILAMFPALHSDDIVVTSSGDTGEDLKFSPLARSYLPFSIETKNQEKISIWAAISQCEVNAKKAGGYIPLLAFKRNHSKLMVCLSLQDFLYLFSPDENDAAPKCESH